MKKIFSYLIHGYLPTLLFLYTLQVAGQNHSPRFLNYSLRSGLSSGSVHSILEDQQGFIWVGTKDGLNKFDGYEFRVYRQDNESKNSLSNNYIRCLIQDKSGQIWIGTKHGLNVFNPVTESFTRYLQDDEDESTLSSNDIISLYQDSRQRIWIGTQNGLNLFDERTGKFRRFKPGSSGIRGRAVLSILEDPNNHIWFSTWGGGLNRFNEQTNTFTNLDSGDGQHGKLVDNYLMSTALDKDGFLWAASFYRGVSRINLRTLQVETFHLDKLAGGEIGIVQSLELDKDGRLLIGSSSGLLIFDRINNTLQSFRHDPARSETLTDNTIMALFRDSEDNVWIGTSDGISLLANDRPKFEMLPTPVGEPANIASLEVIDSLIWVGTDNGVYCHNLLTGGSFIPDVWDQYSRRREPVVVQSILPDKRGNIWLATSKVAIRINRTTGNVSEFHLPTSLGKIFNDYDYSSVIETTEGDIWLGSDAGIKIMRRGEIFSEHLKHHPGDPLTLSNNRINCMYRDSRDRIWVGTKGGGLHVLSETSSARKSFKKVKAGGLLADAFINAIQEDAQGRIFVSTNNGLHVFDETRQDTVVVDHSDGLPSNIVLSCFSDSQGQWWISTGKGIATIDPASGVYQTYDERDGLQGYIFNRGAYLALPDGTLLMGGKNGVNMFHPDRLTEATKPPSVHLTSVTVNNALLKVGSPALKKSIGYTREIRLPFDSNVITFGFAALNFRNPEKTKYKYRLEGFEENWRAAGPMDRTANYTNLDPGTYHFRVIAANHEGIWNESGRSVTIIIVPPLWRTPWAYTIYAAAFIFSLYLFRKYSLISVKAKNRLMIERLENKKIAEITESKMRFFTNVSHEIRTPLTLIAGPLEKILRDGELDPESKKHLSLVARNVRRLLEQANHLLQFRKIDMGFLHLNACETAIVPFLTELIGYFEQHAALKNISITLDAKLGSQVSLWIDREMISTAIYNLLANAIRFTPSGGRIRVSVFEYDERSRNLVQRVLDWIHDREREGWIALEIEDSGAGISRKDLKRIFERFFQANTTDGAGSGIGLSLVKEYVELHKGFIEVESRINVGTKFTISLPGALKVDPHPAQNVLDKNQVTRIDEILQQEPELLSSLADRQNFKSDVPFVLIVEDDPDLSAFLAASFSSKYRVEMAYDGVTGFEKAKQLQPDVIISDVSMPELSGYDMCARIKENINTSHIAVVLLTARTSESHMVTGFSSGADAYITKPFAFDVLDAQVSSIIRSRSLAQERLKKITLLQPSEVKVESADERFLKNLMEHVEKNIGNEEFDISKLVADMGMSHTALYKKLKNLTGYTLVDFIKNMRLKRAAMLLKQEKMPIAEVCYLVGFSDPRYFSKCFVKEFGKTPSEYSAEFHKGK